MMLMDQALGNLNLMSYNSLERAYNKDRKERRKTLIAVEKVKILDSFKEKISQRITTYKRDNFNPTPIP